MERKRYFSIFSMHEIGEVDSKLALLRDNLNTSRNVLFPLHIALTRLHLVYNKGNYIEKGSKG